MMDFLRRHRRGAMALAVLLALGCAALYQGLTVTRYTVESAKLTAGQSFRLAVVTDLHSHIYGRDQSPLLHKILAQQPDAVLLVGDIYDNATPPEGVHLLLAGLRGKVPMYYATGNHEYWTGDMDTVLALFRDYGVTILQETWQKTTLNGVPVTLAGVCDPARAEWDANGFDPRAAMAQGFADLPTAPFSVLLAHRPNWIDEYQSYPFDLVLSGHNHGGQVRIPFLLSGLFGPDDGFFPQYPGGRYDHGAMTHIVSRGLSVNPRLPRVCNPPELVVVDVVGKT